VSPVVIKTTGFENYANAEGQQTWVKCLIMGEHGVGKTPSAAQWPKPLIIDSEKGLMSVARMKVPYIEISGTTPTADMEEAIKWAVIDSRKAPANRQCETLIIDTIDTYQRKAMQERMRLMQKDRFSGWEDWGWLDGKFVWLMEQLLNYNGNVVVNMHVKDTEDDDGDKKILVKKNRLKGDINNTVYQDFDLIGLMDQDYQAGEGDQESR